MDQTVISEYIRLDNLGVIKVNIAPLDADFNCRLVECSEYHSIFEIIRVCDLVQCMSSVQGISVHG